ncbi:MAG: C25 family cysteine peptidase [Saprospiraceae bacterium]
MDPRSRLVLVLMALTLLVSANLSAQMVVGQDTLYGNEWIDFSKTYWKIKVARQDMYRVTYPVLQAGGFPVDQVPGEQYQLFVYGQEVPLYVSTNGLFGPNDYFEFYGDKNKSQLDQFLFEGGRDDMLNPEVSLYTDTAVYFLTTADPGDPVLRYQNEEQDLTGAPAPEPAYPDTSRLDFLNGDYMPTYDADRYIRYSTYDRDEGFASPSVKVQSFSLSSDSPAIDQPATFKIRLVTSPTTHQLQIRFNDSLLIDLQGLAPGTVTTQEITIPTGLLSSTNAVKVEGILSNTDRYQIAWAELQYSKMVVLDTTKVLTILLEPADSIRRLSWATNSGQVLYNLSSMTRINLLPENGRIDYLVAPSQNATSLAIVKEEKSTIISQLGPIDFKPIDTAPGSFLIISHPKLRQDSNGSDPVADYAAYRSSPEGGQYQVEIVNIQDLIDQFGYGIRMHPLSIRNFSSLLESQQRTPKHVFLIGKAIDYVYIRQEDNEWHDLNLIPSYGFTGSDNLLFADPGTHAPRFSCGRIATRSADEVTAYLNKVKIYEAAVKLPRSIQNHAYHKRILHLPAGKNTAEVDYHAFLLDQLAQKITAPSFSGEVRTLKAGSTDPVSASEVGTMIQAINEGLFIKCYLGHGATTTTENFAVDDPAILENQGRYPIILSLGCLTGYTSSPQQSISEAFTLEPEKGSIAYIASSGYGYSSILANFASTLYGQINDTTNYTLGEMLVHVRAAFEGYSSIGYRSLIDQFHFHGDPALKAVYFSQPDLTPDISTFRLQPDIISTETDSLQFSVDLWNLGTAVQEPVDILITLTDPDQTITTIRDTIQWHSSRLPYTRSIVRPNGPAGTYALALSIDPENLIPEGPDGSEENNQLVTPDGKAYIEFQVLDHQPYAIWPTDLSLIHPDSVRLVTYQEQSRDGERSIEIQIDTCPDFSSSFLQTTLLTADSGIRWWQPQTVLSNAVHYWRIRSLQSDPGKSTNWRTASFKTDTLYTHGWNQSHYGQFRQIKTDHVLIDSSSGAMTFAPRFVNVISRAVRISPTNNTRSRIFLDGERVVNTTGKPAIYFLTLEPISGTVQSLKGFTLSGSSNKRQEAIQHVRDEIPDSSIVVVVTFHAPGESFALTEWTGDSLSIGDNLYSILEKEGATLIRKLAIQGEAPYTFAFQKRVAPIAEQIADPGEENAFITFDIQAKGTEGSILSPVTPPLVNIEQIHWSARPGSQQPDQSTCSLWTTGLGDSLTVRLIDFLPEQSTLPIPLKDHPVELQFRLWSQDSIHRTPIQLGYWRIVGDPLMSLYLETTSLLEDTSALGDHRRIDYQLVQFGKNPGDSEYPVHIQHVLPNLTTEDILQSVPIQQGQTVHPFSWTTPPLTQPGLHTFIAQGQSSPSTQNNASSPLPRVVNRIWVYEDRYAPLLQVYIDGQPAANSQPVHQQSQVVIQLRDEQAFLLLQDTQRIQISLTDPSGQVVPLFYSDGSITYSPGSIENGNVAQSSIQPGFQVPGTYKLQVEATDLSGNTASNVLREIELVYSTTSELSSLDLYPNPFHHELELKYALSSPNTPVQLVLSLIDPSGRLLGKHTLAIQELASEQNPKVRSLSLEWPILRDLPPGMYLLQIHAMDANKHPMVLPSGTDQLIIKL